MSYGNSQDSGWRPSANNPTIKVKRDNGVFRGWESTSQANTKAKKPKKKGNTTVNTRSTGAGRWEKTGTNTRSGDARRKRNKDKRTTYDFQDFDRYKGDKTVSGRSGVVRDVQTLKGIKGAAERRAFREKKGLYKGKYYGPDVFKGDKSLNNAWKKSGKKGSPAAFAANYRKASNR